MLMNVSAKTSDTNGNFVRTDITTLRTRKNVGNAEPKSVDNIDGILSFMSCSNEKETKDKEIL